MPCLMPSSRQISWIARYTKIVLAGLSGQIRDSRRCAGQCRDSRVQFERECIVERNRLEDGAQFVITIGAASQNVETQIDFCVGRHTNRFHREVCYYGLALPGVFCCCARRRFNAEIFCSTSASWAGSKSPGKTRCHSSSDFCHCASARSSLPILEYTSPR